jgi:hypothetical protein
MADNGTEATIAPFLRQIEQLHRLGSTIPSGKSSSSTTDPQWHEALCFARITVGPTFLIMAQHILVLHNNEVERRAGAAGINQSIFCNPDIAAAPMLPAVRSLQRVVRGQQPANSGAHTSPNQPAVFRDAPSRSDVAP